MGILSRPRFLPQQRLDLEDVNALLAAIRTDAKLYTKQFLSQNNLIYKGFTVSGVGLQSAVVNMADATLIIPQNTNDFSWFTSSPTEPNVTIPDADLTDGVRNYVEIELLTENNTPLTKAFWDPEANSGLGSEFNQIVATVTDLKVNFVVSIGGFSGSPDRLPLAILDVDGSGVIKTIFDRRTLFGRLSTPSNLQNEFNWGIKQEPTYSLNMTAQSGTFVAGESITIGGETAKVVTGGGASISFNEPTGINFFPGDTVTGLTSGATGTINTVVESFTGADKNLKTQKDINDAIMTEIKKIKNTTFWYKDAGSSLTGISNFLNAVIVQAVVDAKFSWDGSNLSITNNALNPLDSDVISYLREMGKSTDLSLTRQDDGKEIQKISFDLVPSAGTFTLDQNGDVSNAINWNDNAAAVQAACNANFTNQVTVSGNFLDGFTFKFNTQGPQVQIAQASNTLTNGGNAVVITPSTVKNGLAGITSIAIGNKQVMFVKLPTTGNRTYDGVGSLDTNYQVVDLEDFVNSDLNYWIAYAENGLLYIRNFGELQAGEESAISDPDKETILGLIETEQDKSNQDRNLKLIEGGTWSLGLNGTSLTLSDDAYIQIPGISQARNTISAQTISLPNATSVAYVKVLRNSGIANVRPIQVNDEANIILDDSIVVIARRVTDGVLVGNNCFLLQPGEYLTLDGALAEINRYMGQLKIKRHESSGFKVRINAADALLLNGNTLSQMVGNFLLSFTGAVINFNTGAVLKEDDSTALGTNFTPFTIPVGQYFWYGISLVPGNITSDNRQEATVLIDLADSANATQGLAPKPVISGTIKLGAIQIFNNAGTLEVVDLKPLGVGSGSGGDGNGASFDAELRTYLKLSPYEFLESNLIPVDEDDKVDISSTGAYSPATKTFKLANGQTLVSYDLLDPDFVAANRSLAKARVILRFAEGKVDPAPVVELRKNGGSYQAVTMTRIGNTDTFDGEVDLSAANGTALQLRVTASQNDVEIFGYGVLYDTTFVAIPLSQEKFIHPVTFSGDLNQTTFTLPFLPDPKSLVVYDKTRGQSYIYDPGVTFSISGNDVVFINDFFNFPSETIRLEFRQVVGNGYDNADQNANDIAGIQQNLLDLGIETSQLEFVDIPKIVVPNTQITNRAQIVDLSQDLNTRMGINRIQTQQLAQVFTEVGPNGEPVFKAVNDRLDQIRFVGLVDTQNNISGAFTRIGASSGDTAAYVEISFYGTGLNLLAIPVGTTQNAVASVDGGAEGASLFNSQSATLNSRNYAPNIVVPVVSNLSLGIHTVRIRNTGTAGTSLYISGFEILTETTSLRVTPGSQFVKGKRRTLSTLQTISHNSSFESGVLGTKGGRVAVYHKSDGTIGKAVTPTDASQLNLLSANHSNEEIARTYNFREFGAGRTDDFSRLSGLGAASYAFTLDDGTTTLIMVTGASGGVGFNNPKEALQAAPTATTNFINFTFVGTGLDIIGVGDGSSRNYDVTVDGVAIGNIVMNAGVAARTLKVVSGLPYGTHTVRFINTGGSFGISDFVVYQPKTPTIPADAKLINSYNLMANYSASVTSTNGDFRSTGVLTKASNREFTYVGAGWAIALGSDSSISGSLVSSSTATNYMEYSFFGTGVNLLARSGGVASTATIQIDGVAYTGAATAIGTGSSWTPGTSTFTMGAAAQDGTALQISGLSLGLHKIRVTVATNNVRIAGLEIITPVHSYKLNGPFVVQNTLSIGSQSIQDDRKIKTLESVLDEKRQSQAKGVLSSPSTASSNLQPLADMSLTHASKTGKIRVSFVITFGTSAGGSFKAVAYINGKEADIQFADIVYNNGPAAGLNITGSSSFVINVPVGSNKIDLYVNNDGAGTATITGIRRVLTVEDI